MTTTTTPQGVPIPAGVDHLDDWQHDVSLPYRCLFGELRNIDGGTNYTTVQATAVQFTDGRIDDGSAHESPHVYLGDDAPHKRTSPRAGCHAAQDSRRGRSMVGRDDRG